MSAESIIWWIVFFIVSIIVVWIALSLIIVWFKPAFTNQDGTVNWWVTFWVSAVQIIFVWIIWIILAWLIRLFRGDAWNYPDPRWGKYD